MHAKQGQIQSYMRLQRAECRTTCFVVWRGGPFLCFLAAFSTPCIGSVPWHFPNQTGSCVRASSSCCSPGVHWVGQVIILPPLYKRSQSLWMESW